MYHGVTECQFKYMAFIAEGNLRTVFFFNQRSENAIQTLVSCTDTFMSQTLMKMVENAHALAIDYVPFLFPFVVYFAHVYLT